MARGNETSWIVLEVGKRRIATRKLVGDDVIVSALRSGDALLLEWNVEADDLTPPDDAADELLLAASADVLLWHRDPRGILVSAARHLPAPSGTYAEIVAKLAPTGVWIENLSQEEGALLAATERDEIPLPDAPRSRKGELFVMSPARAMRELTLDEAPLRVVVLDRTTKLAPPEVVAFYAPLVKARGFTVKRRVWSDGSAEQLVGRSASHTVLVHAERTPEPEPTFVRLAWILRR
jgi:hypothetical protein